MGSAFHERAAPAGAGLVQHRIIDRPLRQPERLHVLAADIQDEGDIWAELFGCAYMGCGLHYPEVHPESLFERLFAIAGGRCLGQIGQLDPLAGLSRQLDEHPLQ